MSKSFLAMAIISLSNPALAADLIVGDVLYCTSEFFYGTEVDDLSKVARYDQQNFRLKIFDKSIDFGSSGYFSNSSIPLKELEVWGLNAQGENSTFRLFAYEGDISFNYASANPFGMAIMRGTCDKF